MTTERQMAMAYAAQEKVIVALRTIGVADLVVRLEHCMTARRSRHNGDGWLFTCRLLHAFGAGDRVGQPDPLTHLPDMVSGYGPTGLPGQDVGRLGSAESTNEKHGIDQCRRLCG